MKTDTPPEMVWQDGKTAVTIAFVHEAVAFMHNKPKISPIRALEKFVERLKNGEEELAEWTTVAEWLLKHTSQMG